MSRRHSQAMRRRWTNPEYRAFMVAAQRARHQRDAMRERRPLTPRQPKPPPAALASGALRGTPLNRIGLELGGISRQAVYQRLQAAGLLDLWKRQNPRARKRVSEVSS